MASLTIDASTDRDLPAVLCVITEGPEARKMTRLSEEERKQGVIDAVVARFGEKARTLTDYVEQNWTIERYSGGGMIAHTPPGVLTEFGPSLREPCGRIHWAGTESSAIMYGFIDGAVRSGERAAVEVMEYEAMTVAP
jgi:monoamine oxidase